jgi:hypothetical protein
MRSRKYSSNQFESAVVIVCVVILAARSSYDATSPPISALRRLDCVLSVIAPRPGRQTPLSIAEDRPVLSVEERASSLDEIERILGFLGELRETDCGVVLIKSSTSLGVGANLTFQVTPAAELQNHTSADQQRKKTTDAFEDFHCSLHIGRLPEIESYPENRQEAEYWTMTQSCPKAVVLRYPNSSQKRYT